jgi:thiol-disulfide isomerase/thioredoxin
MKKVLFFSIVLACLSTFGCQNTKKGAFILSGTVKNANQLEGLFQEDMMNSTLQLAKTQFGTDGQFTISLPERPKAGIYGLHIGKKQMLFVFNGTETAVQIESDLTNLKTLEYKVKGSEDTESYLQMMNAVFAKQKTLPEVKQFIENTKNPLLGTLICLLTQDFMTKEYIPLHQNNIKRIETAYPNSQYAKEYIALVAQIEQADAAKNQPQTANIQVGSVAPDIQLPDPSGKMYALSALKGKVVLLDFWASWCGPCRRANPEVVSAYERYKDKGFTVFSVSLDKQKEAWQAAIKQDRLNWEYHVSDLRFWDSAPAQVYGVRGIPQQYLIDKAGKIAAIIQPGQAVEPFLKKMF